MLAEVDRTFARTGAATPGWPDPWPERDAPQAAYSRVTDPGRHRILDARLAAWEEVLVDRGLARVERPEALTWVPSPRLPQLGGQPTLLVPTAPGALTFVAVSAAAGDLPVLEVGARAPDTGAALLDVHPACGCDACDSGSADLLQVLDASVLTVVRGGVVLVRAGRREVARTWDGWAASGVADPAWLGDPTAAPEGALVVRGAPWL
nr:DUF6226 family protein [Nocardioides perillae]